MATNLNKVQGQNIIGIVQSRVEAFKKSRTEAQLKYEIEFQKAIAEGSMTYEEQVAFRSAQVEREKSRPVPDNDFIKKLEVELGSVKKLMRSERIRSEFTALIDDTVQGKKTSQNQLEYLEGLLVNETDPDLRKEISTNISNVKASIEKDRLSLLASQIEYAQNDKSVSLLDETIKKTKAEKAKALGSGNDTLAASLDLKVQSLEQTRTQVTVQNTINELTVTKARKESAITYLTELNKQLTSADANKPVTLNGVKYNSVQEFWTAERDKYLSNNFFDELSKEYTQYVNGVVQTTGRVPEKVLSQIQTDYNTLKERPELSAFANKLELAKINTLSTAIEKTATSIYNQFVTDSDAKTALRSLETLQTKYGIDLTTSSQKIIGDVAKDKAGLVNNLLGDVTGLVGQGMTYSQALNEVLAGVNTGKVVAPNFSAQELATQTPGELLSKAQSSTKTNLQQGVPEMPKSNQQPANIQTPSQSAGATSNLFNINDIPANEQQNTPAVSNKPTPTAQPTPNLPTQNPNPSSYQVQKGDTLSSISKKLFGDSRKFGLIYESNRDILKSPSMIQPGQTLKIPSL